jgi:hypothetical protein
MIATSRVGSTRLARRIDVIDGWLSEWSAWLDEHVRKPQKAEPAADVGKRAGSGPGDPLPVAS